MVEDINQNTFTGDNPEAPASEDQISEGTGNENEQPDAEGNDPLIAQKEKGWNKFFNKSGHTEVY